MAEAAALSTYQKRIKRGVRGLTIYLKPQDIKELKILAAAHELTMGAFVVLLKNQAWKKTNRK